MNYLLFALFAVAVLQQLVLAIAGLLFSHKPSQPVDHFRKIAVLVFSDKFQADLRSTLMQFIRQTYPEEKCRIIVVSSSPAMVNELRDLPITVVLTNDNNKVANGRQAFQKVEGVFDIAVSVHQPIHINGDYLATVNDGFQQGSAFMQPWISQSEKSCEVIPEPASGFQTLGLSIPLNNMIYSTPFLWLKQQLEEMKDIENYHQSLQFRMLTQGYKIKLMQEVTVQYTESSINEKPGIVNRIILAIKGVTLALTGKPSMFFMSTWKLQPPRIFLSATMLLAGISDSRWLLLFAVYVISSVLIIVKHPKYNLQKTAFHFIKQFGVSQVNMLRQPASISSLSTADQGKDLMMLMNERDFKLAPPMSPPSTSTMLNNSGAF